MLAVTHLSKSFPHAFKPTLNKVSFSLNSGEWCVVIGSNGSGKSTLLKTISGEYEATCGNILLNGQNITTLPFYKRAHLISSVGQDIAQSAILEMSLLENLMLSQARGRKATFNFYQSKKQEIAALLKQETTFGLKQHLQTPLTALSGGQRQVVAFLMALLPTPKLLLLDEHTSALDPQAQRLLMEYTAHQVRKQCITTLMITHHLEEAVRYGDRLIMMQEGEVVWQAQGEAKKSLSVAQLLDLFHRYEDKTLLSEKKELL